MRKSVRLNKPQLCSQVSLWEYQECPERKPGQSQLEFYGFEAPANENLKDQKEVLIGPQVADIMPTETFDKYDMNDGYRRPKKPLPMTPLHPADERKEQLQKAALEMQKRESQVREEMYQLAESIKRRKINDFKK